MQLKESGDRETLLIAGYGNGGFRIGDNKLSGNLLLSSKRFYAWDLGDFEALNIESLSQLLEGEEGLEIILFGTGKNIKLLPKKIIKHLSDKKIAFDMMDTGAACRTYNVLQVEGRRVGAALLAVE